MSRPPSPRIGILQRVLPGYRADLFDLLADATEGRVSVFAGEGRRQEMIAAAIPKKAEYFKARNRHILSGALYACWQDELIEWLEEWDPDVLIMEANPRYLRSPAAVRWMRGKGAKLIGWGLGSPSAERDLLGIRRCLRRRFVGQFDAMITYSSQGAREYAALGVPPSRIFIAPNAAAPKPIQPLPKRPLRYRGEKPAVVFVGRLQERKRVDLLIRACSALPAETQPLLWVIGDGPNRQGLEKLAAAVYPLTTFFGALHGKDLARRLEMADLFVLPGTGGLAVQQAMSHGLPVIVGEADGTQSDLVRETNGWLLSEQNPAALAGLIAAALRDVPALREKGAESYRIVHEEINLEAMVSVFIDTIHEVWHE